MNKPIYAPKGRAGEYGELAVNIYTGCNHGCSYCYARKMKERWTKAGEDCGFDNPKPRPGIVEAVRRQLEREKMTGKTIFLCFTCDPYPAEIDTTPTRAVIQEIKESGNHVNILTKGGLRAERDFDLLDSGDSFEVTFTTNDYFKPSAAEPNAAPALERLAGLQAAKWQGVKTWVSCEPVIDPEAVFSLIQACDYIDLFKIGKLNYAEAPPGIVEIGGWGAFGRKAEEICRYHGRNYYIKEDLRAEMDRDGQGVKK